MFGGSRKPYSAISVLIDGLTGDQYEESDVSGIVDLVEVIGIQEAGPVEAARAIRKKLKYGTLHGKLRALTILDALIENAGSRFQHNFADQPLLERLRVLVKDETVDPKIREKCKVLFCKWAVTYHSTPGMDKIAILYKQLAFRKSPRPSRRNTLQDTNSGPSLDSSISAKSSDNSRRKSAHVPSQSNFSTVTPSPPAGSSSRFWRKDKRTLVRKMKSKPLNLEKERHQVLEIIASASVASTDLLNALKLTKQENGRVIENEVLMAQYKTCKDLSHRIHQHVQIVESVQLIGSLLSANDELAKTISEFEIACTSVDDDSDSVDEGEAHENKQEAFNRIYTETEESLAGLSFTPESPVPSPSTNLNLAKEIIEGSEIESEESDEYDDPFGDENAVSTVYHDEEASVPWREV